jgi:hypothetical protein
MRYSVAAYKAVLASRCDRIDKMGDPNCGECSSLTSYPKKFLDLTRLGHNTQPESYELNGIPRYRKGCNRLHHSDSYEVDHHNE